MLQQQWYNLCFFYQLGDTVLENSDDNSNVCGDVVAAHQASRDQAARDPEIALALQGELGAG